MQQSKKLKSSIVNYLALAILGNQFLEKILQNLCYNSFSRNYLRFGSIPYAYLSVLNKITTRVANPGKYKLWVNIGEYSGISLYFFKRHSEPFSAWIVSKLVNEGDLCIDIGANIGEYALLMGSMVGSTGKVIAFEPQPHFHELIQNSVALNHFENIISVDKRAVYNTAGEKLKFYISQNPNNTGTSSLVNHGVFVDDNKFVEVQTVTLKEICQEFSIEHINLVKVDVERAELEVLQGMTNLLESQSIDYVLLEQNANSESQTLLCALGYTCWLIDEENRLLINSENLQGLPYFGNFIFVNSSCIAGFMKEFTNNLSA